MMAQALLLVGLGCGPALGCAATAGCGSAGEREAAPDGPRGGDQAPPVEASGCAVGEPRRVGALDAPARALALARGPDGVRLVAVAAEDALRVVALSDGAAPERAHTVPLPAASGLFAFIAWGPELAALSEGACPSGVSSSRCLHLVSFDVDGEARAPLSVPIEAPTAHVRVATDGAVLVVARSTAEGAPTAHVFDRAAGIPRHRAHALGDRHHPGERRPEVLAAAVHEGRWAVLWRVGAIEDPAGDLLLSHPRGFADVEALHHAAMVDELAIDPARPSTLLALATFELHRPARLRFGWDGRLVEPAEELGPGARPAAPFGPPEVARLERDEAGLWLRRLSRARDPVAPPQRLAPAGDIGRAALARDEGGYVLATSAAEGPPYGLFVRSIVCP